MDSQQRSPEDAQGTEKDALRLGETSTPPILQPTLDASPKAPGSQDHIASKPPNNPSGNGGSEALGIFEQLTLRWSRLNVIVVTATLIAIVGTAIVFWLQFQEMSSQTNLLNISARQARRDSAESAIATQEQLQIAQEQTQALKDQVATLRSNFTKEERPIVIAWSIKPYLKADTKISADVFWGNYGKTSALRSNGRGAIFFGKNALRDAYNWFAGEARLPYPQNFNGVVIRPGMPTSETDPNGHRSTLLSDSVISKAELDWIVGNDFSAVIVSRQDYFDQLGNHYWTEGCWSHLATGAIPQCPKHNEVH